MEKSLTCRESVELVTDYLEKALLPELEAQFEAHLSGCPHCTVYLAHMQQTIDLLRHLTNEATPEAVKQDLLNQFKTWQNSQKV